MLVEALRTSKTIEEISPITAEPSTGVTVHAFWRERGGGQQQGQQCEQACVHGRGLLSDPG